MDETGVKAMEALSNTERTLLLVDNESNVLRALNRSLRKEGYRILQTSDASMALNLMEEQPVGVVISDQRMRDANGIEFLSAVKEMFPDTVRMVLSGYTQLESVTEAVNNGYIYKFITKPWEDDVLKTYVREAFGHHELLMENKRLARELEEANRSLSRLNHNLELSVQQKSGEIARNIMALELSQEVLNSLPIAVLAVDIDQIVIIANESARKLFGGIPLVGRDIDSLPVIFTGQFDFNHRGSPGVRTIKVNSEDGTGFGGYGYQLTMNSELRGTVYVLQPSLAYDSAVE